MGNGWGAGLDMVSSKGERLDLGWGPFYCPGRYQLGGLNLDEPETNEFYIGFKCALGGYAWVFPKSEEVANVGLGVRSPQGAGRGVSQKVLKFNRFYVARSRYSAE